MMNAKEMGRDKKSMSDFDKEEIIMARLLRQSISEMTRLVG